MKENNIVFLALGSNLGKREENLEHAIFELSELGEINARSKMYETKPIGYKDQDDFLNMALTLTTELKPVELVVKLQEIEHKMGRTRETEIKNGPRIIDLDIIFYNDEIINQPNLKIPHPRMHKRSFVLEPMKEIAPEKIHPNLQKTISQLYAEL